jgi:hypothetical protein
MNDMKDLQDAIMNRVLTTQQAKKTWKRKENIILFIYVGAILFALLLLVFRVGPQSYTQKLRLPGLAEFESGRKDLIVYYKMFAVSLVFSLIAFGVYFVKSWRSHNRIDMIF